MDLANWTPRPEPGPPQEPGRFVRVAAYEPDKHTTSLHRALGGPDGIDARLRFFGWPALPDPEALGARLAEGAARGWRTMVFVPLDGTAPTGMSSYMRIDRANGVVEVGAVGHGPAMARGPMATEAQYLLARNVFEALGYRRYEWKLDDRNTASHNAARRLGFRFEGVFRKHMVTDRRESRDTAWYAMTDDDWPVVKAAFERYLSPDNLDAAGRQRESLGRIRADLA